MNQFRLRTVLALVIGLSGLGGAAFAHGGSVPEHGGVLKLVADTSVELVRKPTGVEVWVEEEGEEIPSATMTGKLVIVDGGATKEVELQPATDNMLEAKGLTIGSGATVTVTVAAKVGHDKTTAVFTVN
ncbi:MAG TPA: hypothetical protein VF459_16375 [Caulobacteraceae bacterium]